jgi:hypothetical protein
MTKKPDSLHLLFMFEFKNDREDVTERATRSKIQKAFNLRIDNLKKISRKTKPPC